MKFLTCKSISKQILKKLLLISITLCFLFKIGTSMKSEADSEYNLEADFTPELEAEFEEEAKNIDDLFQGYDFLELEGVAKNSTSASKYIVDLSKGESELSGWFAVSNPKFTDANLFPVNPSESKDSVDYQKVQGESFLVNKNFPNPAEKEAKNKLMFFFRFKNGLVYFTNTKSSMNILGSLKPVLALDSNMVNLSINATNSCFSLKDDSEMEWTLCASSVEDKKKWFCSLQKFLKAPVLDKQCLNESKPAKANNKDSEKKNSNKNQKKRIQNILIFPTESHKCNEKWNYLQHGKDWECGCAEGSKQSPINLPSKSNAKITKIRPMFIYDTISPISSFNSADGLLIQNEAVKIYNKNGALRLFHSYLGKIVTSDGAVFHGEEIVFHTPAEHTIDGKHFDLEVQVIHYGKSKGDIARQVVFSFLFYEKPGVFNKFFEKLDYYNLPNEMDEYRDLKETLFIPDLFYSTQENGVSYLRDFSFFSYEGSLTFPPCTERTTYFVAAKPLPISSTIIGLFREALKKPDYISDGKIVRGDDGVKLNNRNVQPLNGRKVFYYESQQLDGLHQ